MAEDLTVDSVDMTPLAVAICHRLHLMNDSPLPCRACITKIAKALPVIADLLLADRRQTGEKIAVAIEDLEREDYKYDEFDVGVFAAAEVARQFRH
jgi:hypothetical protein